MKKTIFIVVIALVMLAAANVLAFSLGFSSPAFAVLLIASDIQAVLLAVRAIDNKKRLIERNKRLGWLERK